ncbi:MAG: hypothetical protein WC306_01350 [Candidatus Paceibacterota bacterium]|jgi:Na+/melibiose symporter-like transporter
MAKFKTLVMKFCALLVVARLFFLVVFKEVWGKIGFFYERWMSKIKGDESLFIIFIVVTCLIAVLVVLWILDDKDEKEEVIVKPNK